MTKQTILISVYLGVAAFGVMREQEQDGGAIRRMSRRISDGHTIAWARHITGQNVNNLTSWDDFNSVTVIPGGAGVRYEDEVWVVTQRMIDGNDYRFIEQFTPLDWGDDPNDCWFVDGGSGNRLTRYQPGQAEIPTGQGMPAVPDSYKYTWISESGKIYGIPVTDETVLFLDNGGAAINIGGGIVALPYTNNPFVSGESVRIAGTTNYNGLKTLTAGTNTTQLRFAATYQSETFDGTETVVKEIGNLTNGPGQMVRSSDGTLYYAHNWNATYTSFITKINPDGTINYDPLNWNDTWSTIGSSFCTGLYLSPDEQYLYLTIYIPSPTDWSYSQKFDLSTGNKQWAAYPTGIIAWPTYGNSDMDADGNYYTVANSAIQKFAPDGTRTTLTAMGSTGYALVVDDSLGIVITSGNSTTFGCRKLDNSAGSTLVLDGVLGTSCLTTYNGFIYATTVTTLYKISWNGTALTIVNSVALADDGQGIYVDLWGNIVVIHQESFGGDANVLWYYDTNLNPLSQATGFNTSLLARWNQVAGEYWNKGSIAFKGALDGTPEVPGTPGQPAIPEAWTTHNGTQLDGASICVYADAIPRGSFTMDGNDILGFTEANYTTVIAGLNYYSIYESFPIIGGTQYGLTQTQRAQIADVRLDFFETLGANLGVSIDESSEIVFSEDDFATQLDPFSGPKVVLFPRGTSREPILYLWVWEPIPMTVRALYPTANIFFDGD